MEIFSMCYLPMLCLASVRRVRYDVNFTITVMVKVKLDMMLISLSGSRLRLG